MPEPPEPEPVAKPAAVAPPTPRPATPEKKPAPIPPPKPAVATRPVPAKPKADAPRSQPKPVAVETRSEPAPAPSAGAATITGRLELAAGKGQPVAPGEISEGLVYFLPKAGNPKPKPGRYTINTRAKGFSPTLLVVPVGSTVRFPNVDTILHNVFSRSPGNSFDLGLYSPGESRQHVFNTPGLAIVNCNVHHTMRANVVVLSTPYYARPGKDGRYRLEDVPPGPGTLVFWHPRTAAQTLQVTAPLAGTAVRRLVATKAAL